MLMTKNENQMISMGLRANCIKKILLEQRIN